MMPSKQQTEVIAQVEQLTFKQWLSRRIASSLNRIPAYRAYRVSQVRTALRAGQVKVHYIRPVGASTYVLQIDNEPTLNAIRAAWQPSLMKRVVAGVTGNQQLIPLHQIGDFERTLLDNNAESHLVAASSLSGVTASLATSVPVERFIIGGRLNQDEYALAAVNPEFIDNEDASFEMNLMDANDANGVNAIVEPQAVPMIYTINDAVSSLLKAAGLTVASCDEVGDGGYGTRYMQVCIA